MIVWLLQNGEPLPIQSGTRKMRTAILADKLLEQGHTVYWWGSAFEHQRKIWISDKDRTFQVAPNFTIRVLCGIGYYKNISLARYIDHRIVAMKFRIQSKRKQKPDIIVASMPCYHLAYESMLYARRNKIPILVDIRDLWPDIFLRPIQNKGLRVLAKIALVFDFAKLSALLRKADALVAMSKGCLEWGFSKIARSPGEWDKVFFHGYQKSKERSIYDSADYVTKFKGKKIFLFIGTFGKSYELQLILDTAKRFYKDGRDDIIFYLAGTGEQYESIKRESTDLPNIFLPGWIGDRDIQEVLHTSWAGIVPCMSVENAAPNKVFEYISTGLPLVSSLEGEIAELIDRYNIGLNYRPGDLEGLYQNIHKLASDLKLRKRMSANAYRFFKKYGDADKIYFEYANHIEMLTEHFKKRTY